jgi:uncharacterized membrane protein YdjX (TVP38/TMEM64 family)
MRRTLARAVPALIVAAVLASLVFLRPELEYVMRELGDHRADIAVWIEGHFVAAVLAFTAIYCVTKAAFLPTGPLLTAAGGLLLGITATTLASSLGGAVAAAVLYLLVDFGVGRSLRARAIPFVERVGAGFRRYGFSYLVAMRLVPVLPFWAGCLVPAILGVRFSTYIVATLVGSLPSIFLYASLGHGLGRILDQGGAASLGAFSRADIILPLFGLAALSLAPVLWKRLRSGRARVL